VSLFDSEKKAPVLAAFLYTVRDAVASESDAFIGGSVLLILFRLLPLIQASKPCWGVRQ